MRVLVKPALCVGALLLALALLPPFGFAQRWRGGGEMRRSRSTRRIGESPDRDIFPGNRFTFARVEYSSRWGWGWRTDYPDSDLNFMLRLSELTTIEINRTDRGDPRHVIVRLTDDELFDYPFIYMLEVGALEFSEEEISALRKYLLRGGFLLVDDFWGNEEWANWEYEINRVFPEDQWRHGDIPLDHPIFSCVFILKEVPQVPAIGIWEYRGVTYERGADTMTAHCKGIWDANGRLMVVVMHNTDLGDGWEREAESPDYFREFSAKKAYPMGINIVVYAMTH